MPQMCPLNWLIMSFNWNFFFISLMLFMYFFNQLILNYLFKFEMKIIKIKFKKFNYKMFW